MLQQEWQVQSPTGQCAITGRPFAEGESFYAVLFEDGESFRRVDCGVEAWQGPPPGCFCYFKTRLPEKEKKKRVFADDEVLIDFFQRLAGETEPARVQFRFVLALVLMRKRLLRFDKSVQVEQGEAWEMTLMRDRSTQVVLYPSLSEDQIENVTRQLGAILHGDMGEWVAELEEPEATLDVPN